MGNGSFAAMQHTERHHKDHEEVNPIAPCNLITEVHNDTIDSRIIARPDSRYAESNCQSRDRVRLAGTIDVFDSRDNTVVFSNCYDTTVATGCDRGMVVHHNDQHRQRDKHTDILFGLISGEHHETHDIRGVSVAGDNISARQDSSDDRIKFLGITIAHAHHRNESHTPNYYDVQQRHHIGKGW